MRGKENSPRTDIYARITERIVADLEKGVRPWVQPWSSGNMSGRITRPLRHNGQPHTRLNVLLLWSESIASGFMSATWMTLRQANELGAHVRKGESGATVVYASRFTKIEKDTGDGEVEPNIPFLRAYTVFDCDQIEGLPDHYYRRPEPVAELARIEHADRFFAKTGAVIRHGGSAHASRAGGVGSVCSSASARMVPLSGTPQEWRVTISIGIAEVRHGEALADMIARADAALYEAKCTGRDRVRVAREATPVV